MDNARKIIISIIAILAIIIITIITMIISLRKKTVTGQDKTDIKEEQDKYINVIENPASVVNGKKPQLVKFENIYFSAKNSIDKYFSYIKEKKSEAVLSTLDNTYINENNLNIDNIMSKNFVIDISEEFNIQDMYSLDGTYYTIFYVKGNIKEQQLFLIANVDFENKTFSIIPSNKNEYEEKINETVEGRKGQEEKIEKNSYNMLETSNLKQDEIVDEYLMDLKEKMINDPEEAYNLIDEEYKNKRFEKSSDFQAYIKENIQNIQNMTLTKYSVEVKDNYTQYVAVDNYQNNYIFKVTSAMKYKVLLDNYTIATEEYKIEYNSLEESDKIATNIDKFIRCINNKDYNQAYSFLDEGFKNNYFINIEAFKSYAKEKFYDYNIIGSIDIKNEGNIFICTVPIKSGISTSANKMSKTFIMQLKEGTDFVMSFNVE